MCPVFSTHGLGHSQQFTQRQGAGVEADGSGELSEAFFSSENHGSISDGVVGAVSVDFLHHLGAGGVFKGQPGCSAHCRTGGDSSGNGPAAAGVLAGGGLGNDRLGLHCLDKFQHAGVVLTLRTLSRPA